MSRSKRSPNFLRQIARFTPKFLFAPVCNSYMVVCRDCKVFNRENFTAAALGKSSVFVPSYCNNHLKISRITGPGLSNKLSDSIFQGMVKVIAQSSYRWPLNKTFKSYRQHVILQFLGVQYCGWYCLFMVL